MIIRVRLPFRSLTAHRLHVKESPFRLDRQSHFFSDTLTCAHSYRHKHMHTHRQGAVFGWTINAQAHCTRGRTLAHTLVHLVLDTEHTHYRTSPDTDAYVRSLECTQTRTRAHTCTHTNRALEMEADNAMCVSRRLIRKNLQLEVRPAAALLLHQRRLTRPRRSPPARHLTPPGGVLTQQALQSPTNCLLPSLSMQLHRFMLSPVPKPDPTCAVSVSIRFCCHTY